MTKLMQLKSMLSQKMVTRVGVLGSKNVRNASNKSTLTNAEIGLAHEFGVVSRNLPRRSFLEMPLQLKMPEYYKHVWPSLLKAIESGNIQKAYKDLGIKGEQVVQLAFGTSGYGTWENSRVDNRTINLIDTAQLSQSITSDVVTK